MVHDPATSPTAAGFFMPAEWEPHAGCLMAWPARPELWEGHLEDAKRDYAAVARAIAQFEPLIMICPPGLAGEVLSVCGSDITPIEIPINDSWARDSGPAFVRDRNGDTALVGFGFNAWGNRWQPHDDDALLSERLADVFGQRFFRAPFVLEGGSFFVDGEGTVVTTEQCLLNPNRNPTMTREQIEVGLMTYLGATTVIWLPYGHSLDTGPAGTDGHIDGVLQYVAPGEVMLEVVADPRSPEYPRALDNIAALSAARDAAGRTLTIHPLDPGHTTSVSFANHYLANGAVIVPVGGGPRDAAALDTLRTIYPTREVVGVPGETIAFGGGGPHCITQQIIAGVPLPI